MNGYFNNLALRSMNAGNMVEPRLPSLFEPLRGTELDAAAPVYSEPRQASPASPASPTSPASIAAPSAPTVSIDEPRVTEEVIERQQSAVTTTAPPPSAPAVVPPSPEEQTGTQTTQARTQIATKSPDKSAKKSVQSVLPRPDKTEHSEEVAIRSIEAATTSEVEEHVSLVEKQEEQDVYLEPPPPTFKTQTLLETEVKPEVVERVIERSRNIDKTDFRSVTRSITNYAWRESETPEPEPSINITIGRVEVRAAPATNTKPTRTRQESPVMPLEEYLRKQRRGDER